MSSIEAARSLARLKRGDAAVCTQLDPAHVAHARSRLARVSKLFAEVDRDGSGLLDRAEVAELAGKLGMPLETEAELTEAMGRMDADGSGDVDLEEFKLWWDRQLDADAGDLQRLFNKVDEDADGLLGRSEFGALAGLVKQSLTEEQLDAVIAQIDTDGSGQVDYHEFKIWHEEMKLNGFGWQIAPEDFVPGSLINDLEKLSLSALMNKAKAVGVSRDAIMEVQNREDTNELMVGMILDSLTTESAKKLQRCIRGVHCRRRVLREALHVHSFSAPGWAVTHSLRLARLCNLSRGGRTGPEYEADIARLDTAWRNMEAAVGAKSVFGQPGPLTAPSGQAAEWCVDVHHGFPVPDPLSNLRTLRFVHGQYAT